ncbi:unnamed protein product [Onchocerca ochengi]|uniref:CBFD_NFYB_HMF domain-containing protein n=1 Tax=Onchocerca ochengi TaxID=42157 RepID=A0A182ET92_ONCOC|nr:unnamed protein product [Onchocerca ochengi]
MNKSVTGDVARKEIKVPKPVNISGTMFCNYVRAYAVLVSIAEEVSYKVESEIKRGKLRISSYTLSDRDGFFEVIGRRYVKKDPLLLNITHHCLPDRKRKRYRA